MDVDSVGLIRTMQGGCGQCRIDKDNARWMWTVPDKDNARWIWTVLD